MLFTFYLSIPLILRCLQFYFKQTMSFSLFTILYISLLWRHSVVGVTVHFAVPGAFEWAGVYRAVVDVDALLASPEAEASELSKEYTCVEEKNYDYHLWIRDLSFDAATGRTLVQLEYLFNKYDYAKVFSANACTPEVRYNETCGEHGPGFRWIMYDQMTTDSGLIKPLASWDDSIYFVYTNGEHSRYAGDYAIYLELRKVNYGYTFPTAEHPATLAVDSFSTLIAYINVSGREVLAGGSLVVVPGEERGDLTFLTVVRSQGKRIKGHGHSFNYVLIAIHGIWSKVLHSSKEIINRDLYYGSKILEGGVSYKDGMVCWSVGESILCGAWTPNRPFTPPADVEAVLLPGQASKVCKFMSWASDVENLTTGVAIAETPEKDGRLVLFFGCHDMMFHGGMGLLVKDPSRAEVDIIHVRYGNESIRASGMFVTDDDLCAMT